MARPVFCPNCGHRLSSGEQEVQPFTNVVTGDMGWDCRCIDCGWHGDIGLEKKET